MSIEERFIPYLYQGYSNETVEALLSDLKISEAMDYDAISEKAQKIFSLQNEEIQKRNTNRSWVVKALDTLLWALTY